MQRRTDHCTVDRTLQRRADKGYNRTLQYLLVGRTTVNGAPLEYGRYRKRCNRVPYTLHTTAWQAVRTLFEQHTTAWQTVQTLFECMEREVNMSEHCLKCLNSTPPHGGLFRHCSNAWKQVCNFMSEHCLDSTQSSA